MISTLKRLIRNSLARTGYAVFHTRDRYLQDGLFTMHGARFRRDPAFRAAYARGVEASGGIDPAFEWRVHVALWAAALGLRAQGDFVECGVNAGFISSAIMHRLDWRTRHRTFYLIDTFAGPVLEQYSPEEIAAGRQDFARNALSRGAYVTDLARIRANFSEWPTARIVEGSVPDVLPALPIGPVAFLHLDMNCAYPERAALEFFWDRLSPGGVVLLDDYAYLGHDRQADAMDAAASGVGAQILCLPTGQGIIVK